MRILAKPLLYDELWAIVEPLLWRLKPRRRRYSRAWEDLPQKMGRGSGMTCWRRLAAWLQGADQIAWFHQYERLRVRYERESHMHKAFFTLGCAKILGQAQTLLC